MIADDKRMVALKSLKAYADELRTEIERQTSRLRRELASVEQSIRTLSGREPQDIVLESLPGTQGLAGKYSGLGPQAAVERFLDEHPGQFFRPSEMAAQLKAQGFSVSNPKLATQQVAIALARATAKGLAIEGRVEGKKAYKSANPRGGSDKQHRAAM